VAQPGPYPADARVGRFFRQRHYLGSRDRRFVGEAAYAWLRYHHRARARWQSWRTARGLPLPEGPVEGQAAPIDVLALARDRLFPWDFERTREALQGLPPETTEAWAKLREQATADDFLAGDPWPSDPRERFAAEVSLPAWLASQLVEERGEDAARRLALALLKPASVDLRVNLRRADRELVRRQLASELSTEGQLTSHSPLGLRLGGRRNLTATTASRRSWAEVQDEGSQLAVVCAEPAPGMTVIDACAGSGGKALALADLLSGAVRGRPDPQVLPPGRILACDVAPEKLAELARRARESGVEELIEIVPVAPEAELPATLPPADLVLVDAPCSGLGTLRRNPELKLRYGPAEVEELARLQRSILERFATLVKRGGRLVYVTCSILRQEGEEVAAAFARDHPEFEGSISQWAEQRLPGACLRGHCVHLDPVLTGTDAFFIAIWRKHQGQSGAFLL
jgi:16S rRNA (cytosine967-C5)-methyltransferase